MFTQDIANVGNNPSRGHTKMITAALDFLARTELALDRGELLNLVMPNGKTLGAGIWPEYEAVWSLAQKIEEKIIRLEETFRMLSIK